MGLLSRIFSRSPRDLNLVASSPAEAGAALRLSLPHDTSPADRDAWRDQLHNAEHLLRELHNSAPSPQQTEPWRAHPDSEAVTVDLMPPASAGARPWRLPAPKGTAVPPGVLRETFDRLSDRLPRPGCAVRFQLPEGDDRSPVFGAGWEVYRNLQVRRRDRLPVDEAIVTTVVKDAVQQTRNASTQVLQQPEHLASLLAMGMHLCGPPKSRAVHFSEQATVRMLTARGIQTPPDGPVLKQARREASARALCQDILKMKDIAKQPYGPIKGSAAITRRIHQGRVLKPDARLQSLPGATLQGAWAASRTLVLERPGPDKALAWATACFTHNIAAVVDLSSPSELALPDAMANGRQSVRNGTHFNFEWHPSGAVTMKHDLPGATATGMQVSVTVNGQPVTGDVKTESPSRNRKHPVATERSLERLQVPLSPGKTVPPRRLLEIARQMQRYRADGRGCTVAVVCPQGDVRAAVVVAAEQLYRRFLEGRLSPKTLDRSVRDLWTRLCLDYSIDLAHEPEQLASLMAMGELLLSTRPSTRKS